MDSLIRRFDGQNDNDLVLVHHRGIAYQRDMSKARISYDNAYLSRYDEYARGAIAEPLNSGRCAFLARHLSPGSSVLDIGAASGTFVRAARAIGYEAKGYDVIKAGVARLKKDGLFDDDAQQYDAVTFWDSLEHIEDPGVRLRSIRKGALAIVALPIFDRLENIRASKHYKPGEHLYYFTRDGFVDWMSLYGFRLVDESTHEVDAGREAIGAYAFIRDLPDRRDYIGAYAEMHARRYYGSSSTELHLDTAAQVVRAVRPSSIVDYGCGRSDLVAHFWRDGARKIARYDPAIPAFKRMPAERFDLALCTDVLEHVPMGGIDRVFGELRELSDRAFLTISTRLARAKLPDGRNSHVTLLLKSEWMRWIGEAWGKVKALPSRLEDELVLVAGDCPDIGRPLG